MPSLKDVNITGTTPLVPPRDLVALLPVTDDSAEKILAAREAVKRILAGEDDRLFVVVGPCSIHDRRLALEYAGRLAELAGKVADRMMLIMRVYFEKPRTTIGWKGLINDPHLNNTFDVGAGLPLARGILLDVAELGLPAATEMLEPITPQYIADLISLASIGARTTESPTHRQMASGLSMPVGYKNGTDGSLEVAINAMKAAQAPHSFLGIDADGRTCVVNTRGNEWGHLILRGGRSGPNYDSESLASASEILDQSELSPRFVVDCSHANSSKDFRRQSVVWHDVIDQRIGGNETIVGLMLESNVHEGNQSLTKDPAELSYGISITDGCIGWEETESLILAAHEKLSAVAAPAAS